MMNRTDLDAIAIIPARAGSKGLPGKNTKNLANIPLISYTIQAALDSGVFNRIIVTSDDEKALNIASEMGVVAVHRPPELAKDDTDMASVVHHILGIEIAREAKAFALLQPTSPLRTARHIQECARLYCAGSYNSVVSVCSFEHVPQKALYIEDGVLQPLYSWGSLNQNRQILKAAYRQNGAVWFVNCLAFEKEGRFVVEPAAPYIMDVSQSIDIDSAEDFALAEKLLTVSGANVR